MDFRNLGLIIVPVLAASLEGCTDAKKLHFHRAIACVRAIVGFAIISGYRCVCDEDFGYMDQYLRKFHETQDIFLQFRTTKTARDAAKKKSEAAKATVKWVYKKNKACGEQFNLGPMIKAEEANWKKKIFDAMDIAYAEHCIKSNNFDFP